MMWQPIETAPKDGTEILVYCFNGLIEVSSFYAPTYDKFIEVDGGFYKKEIIEEAGAWRNNMPSHWMQLPSPPVDVAELQG